MKSCVCSWDDLLHFGTAAWQTASEFDEVKKRSTLACPSQHTVISVCRDFSQVAQFPTLIAILEKVLAANNCADNAANSSLIKETAYSLEQQSQAWETPASNCSHALAH